MDSDLEGDDLDLSGIQELDVEEEDLEEDLGELEEIDLLAAPATTSVTSPSSPKKHKKSKKHKHHKKKRPEGDLGATPPIKLKFKIGGQMVGTKSINVNQEGNEQLDDPLLFSHPGGSFFSQAWSIKKEETKTEDDIFRTKRSDDSTSDEERQWLDALEAGTLDDSGGVKKCKDPKLLTTRQKALLDGGKDNQLLELPSGYRAPELTEEQIQRRLLRAKKRREQAHEKREKDKKQTVERLLKKQDVKGKGSKFKGSRRTKAPAFRYINKAGHKTVSTPQGYSFPFHPQTAKPPRAVMQCGVTGCRNPKKYSCSKTGVPLCSLECYKKNISQHPAVAVTS